MPLETTAATLALHEDSSDAVVTLPRPPRSRNSLTSASKSRASTANSRAEIVPVGDLTDPVVLGVGSGKCTVTRFFDY